MIGFCVERLYRMFVIVEYGATVRRHGMIRRKLD
jgi:hypothetical protein